MTIADTNSKNDEREVMPKKNSFVIVGSSVAKARAELRLAGPERPDYAWSRSCRARLAQWRTKQSGTKAVHGLPVRSHSAPQIVGMMIAQV